MKLDELKEKNLNDFDDKEIEMHIKDVMSLEKSEMKEYLLFAFDNYYILDDNTENSKEIEKFFTYEKFKPIYIELMKEYDEDI